MGRIRGEKSATEFSSNISVHVVRSDSSEGIDNAPFLILDSQESRTKPHHCAIEYFPHSLNLIDSGDAQ